MNLALQVIIFTALVWGLSSDTGLESFVILTDEPQVMCFCSGVRCCKNLHWCPGEARVLCCFQVNSDLGSSLSVFGVLFLSSHKLVLLAHKISTAGGEQEVCMRRLTIVTAFSACTVVGESCS